MTRLTVTVVEVMEIVQVAIAKSRSARGAFCHSAFISNCLTISHTCQPYLLSTGVATCPFEVVCRGRRGCGHRKSGHVIL